MTGRGDLLLAFLAATTLHAGALFFAIPNGGSGGGDAGEQRLTLRAASPQIAALVRDWDRQPEISESAALTSPDAPDLTQPKLQPDTSPTRPAIPAKMVLTAPPGATPPKAEDPDLPVAHFPTQSAPKLPTLAALPKLQPKTQIPNAISESAPKLDATPPTPDFAPRLTQRPPSRPAQTSSPAVTRRVAQGVGSTSTRGTTAAASRSKVSKTAQQAAIAKWSAAIERSIARHHVYPRNTRDQGRARVAMVILPNGQLSRVSIATSSGSQALDRAALKAVRRAAPFPPAPEVLNGAQFSFGQWIVFTR